MDNKITMDRRKFLERFAKLSTATVIAGVCVACPIPAPSEGSIFVDMVDIDEKERRSSSSFSIYLSTIIINIYKPSFSLNNSNLITIIDEKNKNKIFFSLYKSKNGIFDEFKLTLDDNQLNYGSYYNISIDGTSKTFGFDTTPIKLSKETLSLALDRQEDIIVEGLYVNHEMVSDFKILSVENINSDYGDGQNGEVIATIENQIITIKGIMRGKVMLKVTLTQENSDVEYIGYIFVEVTA